MRIELQIKYNKEKFIELLINNTNTRYAQGIFSGLSKKFTGVITDDHFDLYFTSILKGIRPGLRGEIEAIEQDLCLVTAETYIKASDILSIILLGGVALYFGISSFFQQDMWGLIPMSFCLAILLLKFFIYRIRRSIIISAISAIIPDLIENSDFSDDEIEEILRHQDD